MGTQPIIENWLIGLWNGGESAPGAVGLFSTAANLVIGNNPVYQVSDFLAFYPKFGMQPQEVTSVQPNATTPGTGYLANDVLSLVQPDATGATVTVSSVDINGVPQGYAITTQGTGYDVAAGLTTTGGTGAGALIDVLAITAANLIGIPPLVLQLYINLASASLQSVRWLELWPLAMPLFVAHYCTLYLRSEGNVGTTAGQIASSGLTRGIMVSKAAGNVSASIQVPSGLEDWGAWTETEYGIQLATMARIVGMGPSYQW
jgi:Protein of unknown function (DUF4054)